MNGVSEPLKATLLACSPTSSFDFLHDLLNLTNETEFQSGGEPQVTSDGRKVSAKHWGITKAQLQDFLWQCQHDVQWNCQDDVRQFVVKYVKPKTAGMKMGISLLFNQTIPREINLMVSHCWDENADVFFQDVLQNMLEDDVAFICFLALHQGTQEEIQAQLGDNIQAGPFAEVISNAQRVHRRLLVVPNEELFDNGLGLYSRLWCIWELYCARSRKIRIQFTHRRSRRYLLGRSSRSSRGARCTSADDEQAVRAVIESTIQSANASQFLYHRCTCVFVAGGGAIIGWDIAGAPGLFIGSVVGLLVGIPVSMLSVRLDPMDGYDVLDDIIQSAASGGRSSGNLTLGSFSIMMLGSVLTCVASLLESIGDKMFVGYFVGLLNCSAFVFHGNSRFPIALMFVTIAAGAYVGDVWVPKVGAGVGSIFSFYLGRAVTWPNRTWVQKLCMFCSILIPTMAASNAFEDHVWHKSICALVSLAGMVVGVIGTSSGHNRWQRLTRISSVLAGMFVGTLSGWTTSSSVVLHVIIGLWSCMLLGQVIGMLITSKTERTLKHQALLVMSFATCGSIGALIYGYGSALIGGVIGYLCGLFMCSTIRISF